ncbi:MAG: hydantoinase/carbamoylase family amidase [Solirubrobacterales bacterium]|nr:hydantoinase/carbamoylase family amidase [Solirubrobacterales bacterium]
MIAPTIDARRVLADLRELERRTGGPDGARRVCWGEDWRAGRELLGELLAEIGLEAERDPAGNLWAFLGGDAEPALAVGSHLDSVPAGGWLDGAYGAMAAVGVLRSWAESGERPPRTLALVDWADEEGARFGRSLFGSSAFSGSLDPGELVGLRDHEGREIAAVLVENGVELARAGEAAAGQARVAACLELHIEQGPVLERDRVTAAAVSGCAGVERLRFAFRGQAAHAGTTPMDGRRDAGLAAAEAALAIECIPATEGGVATTGELELRPGVPTAVAGEAILACDLRHPESGALARMLGAAREACETAATRRDCVFGERPVWRIEPIDFDPELVDLARRACLAVTGADRLLASGALHDAAEVARVRPAAMIFCPSTAGISHAREEDTPRDALIAGIEAFGLLVNRALESSQLARK